MFKQIKQEENQYSYKELRAILEDVEELTMDNLAKVFGGVSTGDDREEYTTDPQEIMDDIFGTKMPRG